MGCWNGKRISAVMLTLWLACTLSGCWNRHELSTIGIVGMVGLDKAGDGLQLTIEVLKPRKGESGGTSEQVAGYTQVKGLTVANTNRNATLKFDKKIFYPHTRLYVISEEVARTGLTTYTDFFLRDHNARWSTLLYIVQEGAAAEVVGVAAGISDTPSEYLMQLWREQNLNGKSVNTTILDFWKAYGGQGKNPVAGVVRKMKKQKVMPEDKEAELTVEGAAVFKKDKLVGFLDGSETRGYNWVAGKWADWLIVSPFPDGQGVTVMEVLQAKSEKDVEISSGAVKIKVKIAVRGRVGEETEPGVDLNEAAVINRLEAAIAQAVKAEVEHTLTKVQQEYRSDIWGFGQVVHRKYPREWNDMKDNWDEIFAGAEMTVDTEVTLVQIGKSNRSYAK